MTSNEANEVISAMLNIISPNYSTAILCQTKQAAETISQIALTASDGESGTITGPFINADTKREYWHVSL